MGQVPLSERLAAAGAVVADGRAPADGDHVSGRFEVIYLSYAPMLRKIAMRKFGVLEGDAENLVHDVFVTYLAKPDEVRDLHKYLIGAICNASRKHNRRGMKERSLFCDRPVCAATPDDELVNSVVGTLVMRASIGRLGRSCRETVERFVFKGESARAIAESRQTTANSIWRLMHFCRSRLKAIYASLQRAA